MFRTEQHDETHAGRRPQHVHVAPAGAIDAGVVGEQTEAATAHQMERVLNQDVDPRPDLPAVRGGSTARSATGEQAQCPNEVGEAHVPPSIMKGPAARNDRVS
jgi:hypothetical protein